MSVLLTKYNAIGLSASEPITITYQLNKRCKNLPEKVSLAYFVKALDMQEQYKAVAERAKQAKQFKVEAEQEIPMTNTVTVPRGKEFSLRLSDGTQVWLNSESSLVFPVRFGDGPREVTVTGEAYFDVAHDASRRFVVHADTVSVSVYGTAFNLSAYADEGTIETTLVRGSVEVRSGHRRAMLQPGQQARVGREGAIFDVRQVAAEDYAAWTRGLFTFNDEPIASICRKLSRWYGVEIVPRGVDADKVRYTGVVKRYETFAEMARLLARTDQIRADVEEGKIVLCIDRDDD